MSVEPNKPNIAQSSILIVYGLAQVVSFCLMLTIIGFSVNQTFKLLHQVKEINFLTLQHLRIP